MLASKIIFSMLAAYAAAQSDSDSDSPDSNTDTSASSSGLATRLSYVTYTTTNVGTIITSNVGTSRFITSLPPSLATYTSEIPLETTLVPVLTPSVISGTTVVTTNTAGQEETTIQGGSTVTPSASEAAASSTSSAGGAAVTMAHGLVGAAALGFAAFL